MKNYKESNKNNIKIRKQPESIFLDMLKTFNDSEILDSILGHLDIKILLKPFDNTLILLAMKWVM